MEIKIAYGTENWSGTVLILPVYEMEDVFKAYNGLEENCPWLKNSEGFASFVAKKGELLPVHGDKSARLPVVLLAGAGKREEAQIGDIREIVAKAVKKCKKLQLERILFPADALTNVNGGMVRLVQEAVYAALISLYKFTEFKTIRDNEKPDPESFTIIFDSLERRDKCEDAISRGQMDSQAVTLARNLDNLPPNLLYPETFALRAYNRATENGFSCEILNVQELESENMNCLLAVGKGSCHAPRLIILEYSPENRKNDDPYVLVGKGLTFDSGGICLKPAANMWQMKCDMSGAAAVLASMDAIAKEKIDKRIIGLLPCAENLPGGNAYRPGDILVSAKGTTVEVTNTDAEGRLALCDAISYSQKHWQPKMILDIATLTGACAVALGNQVAGLFSNEEKLASLAYNCGKICGDNLWRLPLWPGYKEEIKSPIADVRHTGSREGGAITAALFLQYFINGNLPWIHLDIAGVDWNSKKSALCPEGATGFGTRLLIELLRSAI